MCMHSTWHAVAAASVLFRSTAKARPGQAIPCLDFRLSQGHRQVLMHYELLQRGSSY
jgi:hypothetical protein